MSTTASVGVYATSYWSFMAKVMSRRLEQSISFNRIDGDAFPKGVYEDSLKFFNLVLGAIEEGGSANPPASINAYAIASEAVRGTSTTFPFTLDKLKDVLKDYAVFNTSLRNSRPLEESERKTAMELSKFFCQLSRDGDNERYEDLVGLEAPAMTLRWR